MMHSLTTLTTAYVSTMTMTKSKISAKINTALLLLLLLLSHWAENPRETDIEYILKSNHRYIVIGFQFTIRALPDA